MLPAEYAKNVDEPSQNAGQSPCARQTCTILETLGARLRPADQLHTPMPPPALRRIGIARFDTLGVKLFLAIAGANIVLVMSAYLIYSWSFDKGLVEYLNKADETRLRPLVTHLGERYQQEGSWEWITSDRQRWQDLTRETLGLGRSPRRATDGPPPDGRPAPANQRTASEPAAPLPGLAAQNPINTSPPLTIDRRLLLFNAQRQLIVGPEERSEQAVLKPILVQAQTVGYLGYIPRLQMVASLEHVFQAQQARSFSAIALGLLAAVVLNAALIARWLSQRLRPLGAGAAAVTRGDYGVRLPVQGHDELAQLADDFNHMSRALEAAQQARQRWIADIAHELRTPLASLRAEIEAMQDGVRQPSPDNLDSLAQEVNRLTRLVEDLRLLSLSDLGGLHYRFETIDLGRFVDDFLDDATGQDNDTLQIDRELVLGLRVRADDDRLTQVLSNLLQNTRRYTATPGRLHVRLSRSQNQALLSWEDSTPGVPSEALPRLKDRLFRLDPSRDRSSGGSGLGLSIASAIVEGHGGHMQASSSVLGGLRWELLLPLHDERQP